LTCGKGKYFKMTGDLRKTSVISEEGFKIPRFYKYMFVALFITTMLAMSGWGIYHVAMESLTLRSFFLWMLLYSVITIFLLTVTYLMVRRSVRKEMVARIELGKEKSFIDAALNSIPDAFFFLDTDLKIIRWNDAIKIMSGYDDSEIPLLNPVELLVPEEVERVLAAIKNLHESRVTSPLQATVITREGNRVPVEFFGATVEDDYGNPVGICGIGRDITERKNTEEEIVRLSRRVMDEQEEMRKNVANELYNEIGQTLNALRLELGVLQAELSGVGNGAQEKVRSVRDTLESVVERIRAMSGDLHPALLDDFGLGISLDYYLRNFSEITGISCRLETIGLDSPMPKEWELPLFRITQECIKNVHKHSRATKAVVWLIREDDLITITVEDNGTGFNVHDAFVAEDGQHPLGLLEMRERARMLDGDLHIHATPGHGTTVTVEVPKKPGLTNSSKPPAAPN